MPRISVLIQSPQFLSVSLAALVTGTLIAGSICATAITNSRSLPLGSTGISERRLQNEPRLMIWAWEYPCDLRFVDSNKTGVAYLAAKANLVADSVTIKPRVQTLMVSPDTYTMAVVRIEPNHLDQTVTFSNNQVKDLVSKVLTVASQKKVDALQIDFDARQSERDFYKRFLLALRERMPANMPLSITSLASWCLGDTWLTENMCDEVVPMFFSMGRDRQRMLTYLRCHGIEKKVPEQVSLGLSVDEADVLSEIQSMTAHTYLFSSNGWGSKNAINWINKFQNGGLNWKDLAQGN